MGTKDDQAINFVITNAATGAALASPGPLCPGVTYTVALDFTTLGSGHHLLTSTYGAFPAGDVCLPNTYGDVCKNRVCPDPVSSTATYNLTMPCTLPDGEDNVIKASWGDGSLVHNNKVTYKTGGADCKPCSPSPSPSPRPASSARLVVRAGTTSLATKASTNVTIFLVGYTSSLTAIDAILTAQKIPANSTAALAVACSPTKFSLVKKGSQFVANSIVTCTATAAGRARVRVALKTTPVLANVTAAITVK
ncbi:hypothetical protein OEZ85_007064 [Tetradesmus obliquus]|uniref:Uncharacterized protein n=1 Tax=Tetradesmus obliquus TaxID=3088 RepID=A0ABY8TYY8_TETOB|nr:hypothetical protein OEZ85_007064 [Tetradesmus obliquus]